MSHRLFIAIRPPAVVRDALIDTMEALDGARWQDDDQLHLTLRFVGDVERAVANDLAAALEAICMPPFELELTGVSHFQRKGSPTALWAGVASSVELQRLRAKIERACSLGGVGDEIRRFTPHVTIARLTRSTGSIAGWLTRHAGLRTKWQIDGFSLFESHVFPSGAHHEVAAYYPLNP